ncbi:hypothetical protein [Halomonas heilongjiangensis]|uniref:hypothetical protein n=1 Tax=Halomonas heilongjiangensis TaxID=1387883 RepID=UPI0011AED1AA|nr:hypothetical protein [Halomonas heilongjiangensis]
MRNIFFATLLFMLFFGVAYAQIQATTKKYMTYEYPEVKDTPEFEAYLSGYIDALYQVKRTNEQLGVEVLYCPPDYSGISISIIKGLLERELYSQRVTEDPRMQLVDIGSMLSYSIYNNYPCDK